ncbi:hypothetical protein QEN58_03140 [Halomonas alkaliantarctica]|uniref:Uncharacterized protein n=1 Tax=Halomonas alkaliantarctica TaxID=232346 RepID=A0ABY8LNS4_9GAMM|nr:hypothetical protein [Halomonas alkaliantarctica]WGI26067.1 hypothetical protein QEN58_03140 [Halomonas alkaliantarctica]
MLSPYATHLLLKHFNSIDEAVSAKLLYKRPRDEEDITKSLIDALDEECQEQESLGYRIGELREDLAKNGDPTYIDLAIDTHVYSKQWERYVSQSDLGLVVKYQNYYEPMLSNTWSWLLQAKRLFPAKGTNNVYDSDCKFESFDKQQHERIKRLQEFVDADFFRCLFYCPRPEKLDDVVRQELSYLRSASLRGEIFDFTYGLELRDDLRSGSATVAAGIFVSEVEPCPKKFADIHSHIFHGTTPLSWFILQHLPGSGRHHPYEDKHWPSNRNNDIAERLVRGDTEVIQEIMTRLEDKEMNLSILPSATITVTISQGTENVRRLDRP